MSPLRASGLPRCLATLFALGLLVLSLARPLRADPPPLDTPPRLERIPETTDAWRLRWFAHAGHSYFIQTTGDLSGQYWRYLPVIETGQDALVAYGLAADITDQPKFFARLRIADQTAIDPFAADFDGDGVSNGDELLHFLDPLASLDADADGFPDDWELFYFGSLTAASSPTADSNGDGITDWEAWLLGLNPVATTADRTGPTWPTSQALSITGQTASLLTLTWTEATDDQPGPVRYQLYRNGLPQGGLRTTSSAELNLTALSGWQRWHVRPVDLAGNHGPATNLVELQLREVADVIPSYKSRVSSGAQGPWGHERSSATGETYYYEVQTHTASWNYDHSSITYDQAEYDPGQTPPSPWVGRDSVNSSESRTEVSIKRRTDTPAVSPTRTFGGSASYEYRSSLPGGGMSPTSGTRYQYGTTLEDALSEDEPPATHPEQGPEKIWLERSGAIQPDGSIHWNTPEVSLGPPMPQSANTLVSSGPGQAIYFDSNTIEPDLSSWLQVSETWTATRTYTYSEPVTNVEVEGALSLPELALLPWGQGSPEAHRSWSGLNLSKSRAQYRTHLPDTIAGQRYRMRWLEVFYPRARGDQTPAPEILSQNEEILFGTGGEVTGANVHTLETPEREGTLLLHAVHFTFDVPAILAVNDDFDERVEPEPWDPEPVYPPWTPDHASPSPLRADGTPAFDELSPIWIGRNTGDNWEVIGSEVAHAAVVVTEGADRVRLLAIAPRGSGPNGAYTDDDWVEVASGQPLIGLCYHRTDPAGQSLPGWNLYAEGLAPGKVTLELTLDQDGLPFTETADLYVVRVNALELDPDTGTLAPAGALLDPDDSGPEVAIAGTTAEIRADGALEVRVTGHVRDVFGELFADPAHQVQGLVFYVNGTGVEALANLPAQGTGPGAAPWIGRGSRVEFDQTLVIPDAAPRTYFIEARSTPDAAGRRGSARAVVLVSPAPPASSPPPPSVDASFAPTAAHSPATVDQVRLYSGARPPYPGDALLTETTADSRVFLGQWLAPDGRTANVSLTLAAHPPRDPLLGEESDVLLTLVFSATEHETYYGLWAEPTADAAWFAPLRFFETAPTRVLAVTQTAVLEATEPKPPRPLLLQVEGLPEDLPPGSLPAAFELAGQPQSLTRLNGQPGWFLARPDDTDSVALLLAPGRARLGLPTTEILDLDGRVWPVPLAAAPAGPAAYAQALALPSPAPTELALRARALAAGRRGMAETQAYLEAQGYYDEDPTGPPEREVMTLEELRGWTLMAFGRPAYHAMILFEEKRQGVVEFVDLSWLSPLAKNRGYILSKLNEPLRIQLDASLEPLNAAHAFMDALTEFLGQSPTREAINVLFGEVPPDARFTAADREKLAKDAFRIAWSGGVQRIDLLASAAETGVRVVFSPLDLTLTIFEAIDGDKAALLSLGLAATPIDNVLGFAKKVVTKKHIVQEFSPALQPVLKQIFQSRNRIEQIRTAREMIDNGSISASKWRGLVDRHYNSSFKTHKPRQLAIAEKLKITNATKRPDGKVLHHYLPLQYEPYFLKAGLDPNDPSYTEWVKVADHLEWHSGIGQGRGGRYNNQWRLFFTDKPNANASEIVAKLSSIKITFPHQ